MDDAVIFVDSFVCRSQPLESLSIVIDIKNFELINFEKEKKQDEQNTFIVSKKKYLYTNRRVSSIEL